MQARNSESSPEDRRTVAAQGRRIRLFALIVVAVLAIAFVLVHFVKASHDHGIADATAAMAGAAPAVNVVTVVPAPSAQALSLPGESAAWFDSTLYARVDGYVAKWSADIGDRVKRGQTLATIETPDLDAQQAASEAKLKAAQALVMARQADAQFAKSTYDRWRDSPKGVVSEQEREEKKAGYDSAAAQLSEAQAQVALDSADVDRYTILAKFKRVTAPYDGVITERRIDIGNLVSAGSNASTTPLYKMAQTDPIRVFVNVPQSAAGQMKPGVSVKIRATNIPGRIFEGKVTRTSDAIDPQARTLRVEADIANPDRALVPGMYVDVAFDIPTAGWVQIPAAALIFRPSGQEVAVIGKDERVSFRVVSIARDNGSTVEIGSGLAAGERVALNISSQIAAGQKVAVSDATDGGGNGPSPQK